VLYIEFLPIVVERFKGRVNLPGILRVFNSLVEAWLDVCEQYLGRFISLFIIAGVVLSCLHQSSLGTLMLIAPTKMHPLWYTPISPLLFLMSAIAVGFPMVIFESILASKSFRLKPELPVLSSIARYTPVLLGAYLAVKIGDLTLREAWPYVFAGDLESFMYIIELTLGALVPVVLLSIPKVRHSVKGLFIAATLVIFGVALNRINVFLVAYEPLYPEKTYYPSVFEIMVTLGLISALVLVYRFVVLNFPVISGGAHNGGTGGKIDVAPAEAKVYRAS
jgi:Ni/Fe-hydrogenase subunit HybB-like protein